MGYACMRKVKCGVAGGVYRANCWCQSHGDKKKPKNAAASLLVLVCGLVVLVVEEEEECCLGSQLACATCLDDLLLSGLGEELCAHNNGDGRQAALAEHLEEALYTQRRSNARQHAW